MKKYYVNPYIKLYTDNVAFISDLHLFHKNVIKYDKRPYNDINHMHTDFINMWNSVINENTEVFILGDIFYGKNIKIEIINSILNSLNGKIRIVLGNHDRIEQIELLENIIDVQSYYRVDIKIKDKNGKKRTQEIILSHYPIYVWDKHHKSSYHLHGHCHRSLLAKQDKIYDRKIMDVGINCIGYQPIYFNEVDRILQKKQIINVDHHQEKK